MPTGINNAKRKPKPQKGYRDGYGGPRGPKLRPPPPEFAITSDEVRAELEKWEGLIWKISHRYWRPNRNVTTLDDIRQVFISGWMYAATVYDRRRQVAFCSYATWWGESYVRRFLIREHSHGFRDGGMFKRLVRKPRPVSMNAAFGKAGLRFADTVPARRDLHAEETPEFPEDFWGRVYKFLDPVKREIIRLRYREEKTLEEVAVVIGVTRERVRQIEQKALEKIRDRVDFGSCVEEL